MIRRTLAQAADMLGAACREQDKGRAIAGVSIDTRTLVPGNLFIPIRGVRSNGHAYVRQAIADGAAAALWMADEPGRPDDLPLLVVEDTQQALWQLASAYRRQLPVRVAAVTGSNGKTSTKDMLAGLLSTCCRTQKTPGNWNNHFGVPLTLLSLREDTEWAVVELGMSASGEIAALSQLVQPEVAIITSVSEVHLGDLPDRTAIADAKLEVVEGFASQSDSLLIVNGDNPLLLERLKPLRQGSSWACQTFGEAAHCDWRPAEWSLSEEGVTFRLSPGAASPAITASDTLPTTLKLAWPAKHQMLNAIGAIAAARHIGVPASLLQAGLDRMEATGLRAQLVTASNGAIIINDAYKSNPASARAALDMLYALYPGRRKLAVLGEMVELGPEAPTLHRQLGEGLERDKLDHVLTVGPMARHLAEAARTQLGEDRVTACADKEELLEALRQKLSPNDLLLVKGSRSWRLEELVDSLASGKEGQS